MERRFRMSDAITLKVEDMACGHCAGAITKAVEGAVPGARVAADPATKLVTVTGAADRAKVEAAISAAGYTPKAA
jgi:copper chaperone